MSQLETPRLLLRAVQASDADEFIRIQTDPRFYRYVSKQRSAEEIQTRTAKWIEYSKASDRNCYAWTIVEKNFGAVIGNIHLWPLNDAQVINKGIVSLGYGIDPDQAGQGYMSEALQAVTDFVHDTLKIHRIEAMANAENIASWRVMEKCGYTREAERRYRYFIQGAWWPLVYDYASVRPELIHLNHPERSE